MKKRFATCAACVLCLVIFYPEPERIVTGFVFHGKESQPWVQYPPYLLENRYGETGKEGPEETVFLEIDFIYRDDGTLACRKYSHNAWMWGTSYGSGTYLYDEAERLISETLYVTHGAETYYYIYADDGNRPAYAFMLDSGGAWGCGLFPVK